MMKKLVVLMMVLGLATMANAGLQISVNGSLTQDAITLVASNTVTIDIYNPAGVDPRNFTAYLDFLPNDAGAYNLANARLGPQAGDFPSDFIFNAIGTVDEYTDNQNWAPGTVTETPGTIFLVDFHCLGVGTVTVNLYDSRVGDGMQVVDTLTIHQIPEPMTMALLGLGGLFLRRRK
jgi:hypothetical protein